MEDPEYVTVTTTLDGEGKAEELADEIVRARLAACVQRVRIKSTYWWKDEIEQSDEWLLMAKTCSSLAEALCDFIKSCHSYEVPEIVVTPIIGGSRDYLRWIGESVLKSE